MADGFEHPFVHLVRSPTRPDILAALYDARPEGLTVPEIAERTGRDETTLYSHLSEGEPLLADGLVQIEPRFHRNEYRLGDGETARLLIEFMQTLEETERELTREQEEAVEQFET